MHIIRAKTSRKQHSAGPRVRTDTARSQAAATVLMCHSQGQLGGNEALSIDPVDVGQGRAAPTLLVGRSQSRSATFRLPISSMHKQSNNLAHLTPFLSCCISLHEVFLLPTCDAGEAQRNRGAAPSRFFSLVVCSKGRHRRSCGGAAVAKPYKPLGRHNGPWCKKGAVGVKSNSKFPVVRSCVEVGGNAGHRGQIGEEEGRPLLPTPLWCILMLMHASERRLLRPWPCAVTCVCVCVCCELRELRMP